ncbi:MAG: N-acetylmuramoyl-L-alanine amidase [Chloroflexia bacterium]|nr:N-acetylmuramoyl-L-alanine amidase [Chloroflexia bacterium]
MKAPFGLKCKYGSRIAGWLVLPLLLLLGSASLVSSEQAWRGLAREGSAILSQSLHWSGGDFGVGHSKGPLSQEDGLGLTLPSSGVYTSPVIPAPLPFSELGCSWEAILPEGSSLMLELRSSPDVEGDRWTPWIQVEEDPELPPMAYNQYAGELFFVPQQEGVHQRFQYRLSLSSISGQALPSLESLDCTLIDARAGPSTADIMGSKGRPGGLSSLDQPPLVSREEWGCPEGEESPRWPPEYEPVTHVIVHHTATPNDDVDWAARVRAIWYYHAETRGWGDIGYNYIIDPLGNVYEGRAGGEDVIGGHAHSYNPGTMGLGCLGTYSTAPVPAVLQETLEALIAWKASQRGIDPLGESFNNHKVYDHIAGHRDVGQTSCPGDVLYGLLPAIRLNVQVLLLQQEESILLDELDPEFSRSQAYWHEGCGYEEHSWWTHTTVDPALSANWGIWRPELLEGGWYEVFAYIPSCADPDLPAYTTGAHYRVYYRDGGSLVVVDQDEAQGRWASLGTYPFYAGSTGYVYLDDMADDHWHSLWYDAVRWVFRGSSIELPPAPQLQAPADGVWLQDRQVVFSWSAPPTATLAGFNLVLAADAALSQPLLEVDLGLASSYSVTLNGDTSFLYWSVRAYNDNGWGPFAPARRFGVDTSPPTSSATDLYCSIAGSCFLLWEGHDNGSGVACYTVQVRDGLDGVWLDLWSEVGWTSGVVDIPAEGIRYFRVHARDALGFEETPHEGDGDLSSLEVSWLNWGWYMPLVLKAQVGPTGAPTLPPTVSPRPSPTPTVPLPPTVLPTATPTPVELAPPSPTPVPTISQTRAPSPTPGGSGVVGLGWADLRVMRMYSSQDSPFDCARPAGIAVDLSNLGMAAARSFYVELRGSDIEGCRWYVEELQPGQHKELVCPEIVLGTVITVTIDPENTVVESDEHNNQFSGPLNVLVLPTCTPRPSTP